MANGLWVLVLSSFNCAWVLLQSLPDLFDSSEGKTMWHLAFLGLASTWAIWKERNRRLLRRGCFPFRRNHPQYEISGRLLGFHPTQVLGPFSRQHHAQLEGSRYFKIWSLSLSLALAPLFFFGGFPLPLLRIFLLCRKAFV